MLLGDLLARFDDESVAAETIVRLGDLSTIAALRAHADADGKSLGAYAAGMVRRFTAEASDETWITLMGAMARADDPGAMCLKHALAHGLRHGADRPPGAIAARGGLARGPSRA